MKKPPGDPRRVLVIRLGAFGDLVRTLPAVAALRRRYPRARLAWLVEEGGADILRAFDDADELIVVPRRRWTAHLQVPWLWPILVVSAASFVLDLRRRRFDMTVDFHGILKSGLASWLSGARRRIGFVAGHAKEANWFFNNARVNPGPIRLNRLERNLRLVEAVGGRRLQASPALHLDREASAAVRRFLDGLRDRPFAAVYPGTSRLGLYKRWPPARYAETSDLLSERLGLVPVVLWGPGEAALVRRVVERMRTEPVVAPPTSQRELGLVLRAARCYVGGDTGAMHLAALVGTPVVAIFGPSDPLQNAPAPYVPSRIVRVDVQCSPCRRRDCANRVCLEAVTPEMVIAAVKDVLSETARAAPRS